jgi:arsenate reductase
MTIGGAQAPGSAAPSTAPIRVIFVCTGNSARSQMAEAVLRQMGGDHFDVVSAGVTPRPVNPLTIRALAKAGIDISGATSKPVGMFLGRRYDYVITLCDRARVTCPVFPGGTQTLHWGLDDPNEAEGTDEEKSIVFDRVLREVSGRIHAFMPLALVSSGR